MSKKENIATILELEKVRVDKGFKPGWIYFKCKDLGLDKLYADLQKSGELTKLNKSLLPKKTLTIELVPETCWFSNVRSQVEPEDWDKIKKATYKKAEYLCEICYDRGPEWPVECHEIWNYDEINLVQKLEGFIALCPDCHRVKHFGFAQVQGTEKEALKQLRKINGWDSKETNLYIKEQFKIWEERSKKEWKLDISLLEKMGFDYNNADFIEVEEPHNT